MKWFIIKEYANSLTNTILTTQLIGKSTQVEVVHVNVTGKLSIWLTSKQMINLLIEPDIKEVFEGESYPCEIIGWDTHTQGNMINFYFIFVSQVFRQ